MRSGTALLIGGLGGWVFYEWNVPLAWMLGSMVACAIAAFASAPIASPAALRPMMTALIGTALGSSFGPHLFDHATDWIVTLAGLVLFISAAGCMSFVYFRALGKFDVPTAFFSGMPGGIVEMVTLGGERGGDERMIALIHTARIFLVVLSLPFLIETIVGVSLSRTIGGPAPLAGMQIEDAVWFVGTLAAGIVTGRVLRLPAAYLLGPMLISALVHFWGTSDFTLPVPVVSAAQIVIGAAVGCRFIDVAPRLILKVFGLSLGSACLLLLLTLVFSTCVSMISGQPVSSVLMAYSPGGLTEMSLIALSLHAEAAFVVAHHVARVILIIAGSSVAFRWAKKRLPAKNAVQRDLSGG